MKRSFAALALIFTLILPSIALADSIAGLYLAPKFLMTFQNTGTVSRSSALSGSDVSEFGHFALGGALALGYDFWPQMSVPIRAEIEYALRANTEKTWQVNGWGTTKGTWNNSTLFANLFWDFRNDTAFTPYIGGGLGVAFKYMGFSYTQGNNHFSADDRFTSFAWNVGAGISYNINEQFTIDAAYRFVGLGYDEVSATVGNNKYEVGHAAYNNEFMLGLRFGF